VGGGDATNSVVDLFVGQNSMMEYFTFTSDVPLDTEIGEYSSKSG
jgi:hypothetical protein